MHSKPETEPISGRFNMLDGKIDTDVLKLVFLKSLFNEYNDSKTIIFLMGTTSQLIVTLLWKIVQIFGKGDKIGF